MIQMAELDRRQQEAAEEVLSLSPSNDQSAVLLIVIRRESNWRLKNRERLSWPSKKQHECVGNHIHLLGGLILLQKAERDRLIELERAKRAEAVAKAREAVAARNEAQAKTLYQPTATNSALSMRGRRGGRGRGMRGGRIAGGRSQGNVWGAPINITPTLPQSECVPIVSHSLQVAHQARAEKATNWREKSQSKTTPSHTKKPVHVDPKKITEIATPPTAPAPVAPKPTKVQFLASHHCLGIV